MDSILVTGAAGFIGSHVAEKLLQRGDKVIGYDEVNDYYNPQFKEKNLEILKSYPNFTFIKGRLEDLKLLEESATKHAINKIAHLAARAGVRPSIEDPLLYQSANVHGTMNVLEVAKKLKPVNTVITSSSSVYGNSKQVPFREDDNATDRPISPYAATKKATEVLSYTYHQLYQLPINVIRPFTVYGPRGRPDMAPWLFIERAIAGKPIQKFGDGTTRRDYTFIGDFVSGFVNAIDRPLGYEIFNLGNSATVSLNEAIQIVEEVTGKKLNIDQKPMQPGDVELTNADISKAKEHLDYNPVTKFKDGMEKFYEWFKTRA